MANKMNIAGLEALLSNTEYSECTKNQTRDAMKTCLKICNTDNIYDMYNGIDRINAEYSKKSDAYKVKTLRLLRNVLKIMTPAQLTNIEDTSIEKLTSFLVKVKKPVIKVTKQKTESVCEFDEEDDEEEAEAEAEADEEEEADGEEGGEYDHNEVMCLIFKLQNSLKFQKEQTIQIGKKFTQLQEEYNKSKETHAKELKDVYELVHTFVSGSTFEEGQQRINNLTRTEYFGRRL